RRAGPLLWFRHGLSPSLRFSLVTLAPSLCKTGAKSLPLPQLRTILNHACSRVNREGRQGREEFGGRSDPRCLAERIEGDCIHSAAAACPSADPLHDQHPPVPTPPERSDACPSLRAPSRPSRPSRFHPLHRYQPRRTPRAQRDSAADPVRGARRRGLKGIVLAPRPQPAQVLTCGTINTPVPTPPERSDACPSLRAP